MSAANQVTAGLGLGNLAYAQEEETPPNPNPKDCCHDIRQGPGQLQLQKVNSLVLDLHLAHLRTPSHLFAPETHPYWIRNLKSTPFFPPTLTV